MRGAALCPQKESMRVGRHGWVGTRHGYQTEGLPRRSGAGPKVDSPPLATQHATQERLGGGLPARRRPSERVERGGRRVRNTASPKGGTVALAGCVGKQTHRSRLLSRCCCCMASSPDAPGQSDWESSELVCVLPCSSCGLRVRYVVATGRVITAISFRFYAVACNLFHN